MSVNINRALAGTANSQLQRRDCVKYLAAAAVSPWLTMSRQNTFADETRRPRVAAIFTKFFFRSHTYNILINLLGPYLFRGQRIDPGIDIVSMYADQIGNDDLSKQVGDDFKIPRFTTIADALCVGRRELDVDAVLLIGEHGEYRSNSLGQVMYPRKEFFDQIVAVMRRSQRFVPIFNDKHLSYRWDWAKSMYDEAASLGIPLMAGSSVPLAERIPAIELPAGKKVQEAISIHGGGVESYDFHALEVLQSLIESRSGGETGIAQVRFLDADACREAAKQNEWSVDLVDAAMNAEVQLNANRRRARPAAEVTRPFTPNHAIQLTYKDGTRATVLQIGSSSDRWNFACRLADDAQPIATSFFNGPWGNRNLFAALSNSIVSHFKTRKSPYPVERTLLVSGVLDAAMHSRAQKGLAIKTPHLEFSYTATNFESFRENGASWKIITSETPEPKGFEPGKG